MSNSIRSQFPQLNREIKGKPYTYFDSAATTLKPQAVIDRLHTFYQEDYATIHRGAYHLSEKATSDFEAVRPKVQSFINGASENEVIFTRGTTESINLVAQTYGRASVPSGGTILVSAMEHHSNIVPWQLLSDQTGAQVKVIPMDDRGVLDLQALDDLLKAGANLVCFNHVSNALGTVNPVAEICAMAREAGAVTVVDGAQSAAHLDVDVQSWGCDFFAFSGHKIYGPTGVGVLYGRLPLLQEMPPWQGGGDMIFSVSFEGTTYAEPPAKFEAGTPAIAEVIGLGAAIDWIAGVGKPTIQEVEDRVQAYALEQLSQVPQLKLVGQAPQRAGAISFTLEEIHPHDMATLLDGKGVAIRAGHHCAQPVMDRMGVSATARASIGCYNNNEDVDRLVQALMVTIELFS